MGEILMQSTKNLGCPLSAFLIGCFLPVPGVAAGNEFDLS
jgi:hypothetical protein